MFSLYQSLARYATKHWRGILTSVVVGAITIIILGIGFKLIGGQSYLETQTLKQFSSFPAPWYRGVNALYLVPAFVLGKIMHSQLLGARLTSIILCAVAIFCMFALIKSWLNTRIAIVALLLFTTSSWLLAYGRLASPLILLVIMPLLLTLSISRFYKHRSRKFLNFIFFAVTLAMSVYVPYMFWVAGVVMLVLLLKERKKLFLLKGWQVNVSALVFILILVPLFYSFLYHPGQVKELLGWPAIWPTLSQYGANLGHFVLMIFFQSQPLPALFLGRLAMLDFFSAAMFILGIYYLVNRLPNRRALMVLGSLLIIVLVLPLNNLYVQYSALIMPFVYITIAFGFLELIDQWVAYFPRNPLVKNVGIILVVLSIGLISFYHLQRFYVAWPNSPDVKKAYMVKLN